MHLCSLLNSLIVPSQTSTRLTIHFIDVGHGDATLIHYNGKYLLIDAGSNDIGDTVSKYLHNNGVKRLNVVVASHPDQDHIGGMLDVLKAFPTDLYIDNGEANDKSSYEKLMAHLNTKKIPYTVGRAGLIIPFADGITATITSPSTLGDDMDENSICIIFTLSSDQGEETRDLQG